MVEYCEGVRDLEAVEKIPGAHRTPEALMKIFS